MLQLFWNVKARPLKFIACYWLHTEVPVTFCHYTLGVTSHMLMQTCTAHLHTCMLWKICLWISPPPNSNGTMSAHVKKNPNLWVFITMLSRIFNLKKLKKLYGFLKLSCYSHFSSLYTSHNSLIASCLIFRYLLYEFCFIFLSSSRSLRLSTWHLPALLSTFTFGYAFFLW